MSGWIGALSGLQSSGRPAVLVTVLRAEGSTPREAGAKMVVAAEEVHGTVGGGHLELAAIRIARELLAEAERGATAAPSVRDFPLGPSLGQCCGGAVSLLFEAVLPPAWRVAVFGAGHVGKALVKLLADLPCHVVWVDSRASEFPDTAPARVTRVVSDPPADAVADLPPGADVVILTHSHQLDLEILEAVLRRGDQGYLGVIGSRTKRARFLGRLAQRGFAPEAIARVTCPIGLPGVGGKHPAEIAVAVAAELLQRRSAVRAAGRTHATATPDHPAEELG